MASPLVIGHRGAPGYLPEHTRSSYELALASGVDAVEPDVVFTRDGHLVVRHENEIGGTTDVADHPEFASRRTTKTIDGIVLTGWFTEDFTAAELAGLRCRERLPQLRPESARADGREPVLLLSELLDLVAAAAAASGRAIGVVLEIKHATFFTALGFDVPGTVCRELEAAGWATGRHPLWIESFEPTVLDDLRATGLPARYVFLLEAEGRPADLVAADGDGAPQYPFWVSSEGLAALAGRFDGISVDKRMLLAPARGRSASGLVADAHANGLSVFTWTCRPENAFLVRRFRRGRDRAALGDYAGEWAELAASGVDGVFVDHPDLGISAFRG
ncbi:glycerophosphodiester phosphodiesterase family protein [Microbacterium radiodurans]|uniref:glycerophosphodiester phosphodiesterase n=1 Tax=Microbacterium radiodurans TaxID=661398 RepID=A0A5J5IR72_9MICO|nr:glycerophosphodiester phosphodiesterase family protein [Microbacterium radiodurans]KAA9084931.1 glycerophosphodiester phosphodiesterase [Microbacterium radiodurans]